MSFTMIYDTRNRANINKLADNTKQKALQLHQYCIDNKIQILIYDTIRTQAQQQENIRKGVSKTMKSYHLVGMALDWVLVDSKKNALWNGYKSTDAQKVIKYAKSIGFVSGYDWGWDAPHLQYEHKGYGTDTYGKKTVSNSPASTPSNSKETITSYLEKYNLDSSFAYRKELASLYKISNYTGTVNQNNILLSKLQNDKTVMFRFYSGEVKDEITANKVKDKINSKQPNWTLHIIQLGNKKWQVKSGTYKTFDSVAQASQIVSKLGYSANIKAD